MVTKTNITWVQYKAKKELEIKQKYKAKLLAFYKKSSILLLF